MYPCTDHYLHCLPENTLFAKYDRRNNFLGFFIKGKNTDHQYFWMTEVINPLKNHEDWHFQNIIKKGYISPEWDIESKYYSDVDSYIYLVFESDEIEYLIDKLTKCLQVSKNASVLNYKYKNNI